MDRARSLAKIFVLGVVGGVLILTLAAAFMPIYIGADASPVGKFGILAALVLGVVVVTAAAATLRRPIQGMTWGTVMVLCGSASAVSFVGIFGTLPLFSEAGLIALGAFVGGLILSILGGVMAVVAAAVPGGVVATLHACPGCGTPLPARARQCPNCGRAAAVAPSLRAVDD